MHLRQTTTILTFVLLMSSGFGSAKRVASTRKQGNVMSIKPTLQQAMVSPSLDVVASQVVITLPPGDLGAPPHVHPGPTVGYVIQGEFLFQVTGKPQQIISAGEAFYELNRDIHVWSANASNSTICEFVATVYGEPGLPVNTFVDYKRESREEALALAHAKNYRAPRFYY